MQKSEGELPRSSVSDPQPFHADPDQTQNPNVGPDPEC